MDPPHRGARFNGVRSVARAKCPWRAAPDRTARRGAFRSPAPFQCVDGPLQKAPRASVNPSPGPASIHFVPRKRARGSSAPRIVTSARFDSSFADSIGQHRALTCGGERLGSGSDCGADERASTLPPAERGAGRRDTQPKPCVLPAMLSKESSLDRERYASFHAPGRPRSVAGWLDRPGWSS